MPGKIKVKVLAGRNLPVMDRASDTTDAFVEIKFGGVTHKTDVCRKSLNPQWSSTEWYRFEVDESELQDEPLQLRLMDHDTYSANDAIGKVVISLAPLLAREANNATGTAAPPGGAVMSGWIPVFDTMHGVRGELNVIVKVELFSDFNKYKTSSCGVQFFHCSMIPPGYRATAIHGFVEELIVNDDPEYQWIDKIRTPRASNEARQVAFINLSNQVQRLVGLKAAELGANAVVGYQQDFDLEGEAGVVARAIGTAVSITPLPTPSVPLNIPCTQQQLKKVLDILATDEESVSDLHEYYQSHQEELMRIVSILNPQGQLLLDDPDTFDDDEKSLEGQIKPVTTPKSYTGDLSIYQDNYVAQKSLRHLSEDQIDLDKLLNRPEPPDSINPLKKFKKIKDNLFSRKFNKRSSKPDIQDDQISLKSTSSETSRISLSDIKKEIKKIKKLKLPKVINEITEDGVGMASILARSVIHAHTSLACITESQDSENSPCSTLRRTSESEPNVNISDDDKTRPQSAMQKENEQKNVPEVLCGSLENINKKETVQPERKISESCPTSPVVSRSENFLKLPEDKDYYGSVSSALSADSSEIYSSSDEDDESYDMKSDQEQMQTTSSVIQSVLGNANFVAKVERKPVILDRLTIEKTHDDQAVNEYVKSFDRDANFPTCGTNVVVDKNFLDKEKAKVEALNSGDSKCVPSTSYSSHHLKLHNPFAHKKAQKSVSAPSSPVEKKSFIYRSSKKLKRQLSKISKNSMIKSLSHYSLLPKKKHVDPKTAISQPGSSSDVTSRAPSDTVLGSPFLSYTDLLFLDKQGFPSMNQLHKSDEHVGSKAFMYIGSEPVSRSSLSGPSFKDDHYFSEQRSFKKEHTKRKSSGLVHTAMETILMDKVESLLIPTSPDPTKTEDRKFFDDVNEKLEKVQASEIKPKGEDKKNFDGVREKLEKDERSQHKHRPENVPIKSQAESKGLVHSAMETMLIDKVQSLLMPTTPDSTKTKDNQFFAEGKDVKAYDKRYVSDENKSEDRQFINEEKHGKIKPQTEKDELLDASNKKNVKDQTNEKTYSERYDKNKSPDPTKTEDRKFFDDVNEKLEKVQVSKIKPKGEDKKNFDGVREKLEKDERSQHKHRPENVSIKSQAESKGLVHSAMETMLIDKVQSLLMPTTPDSSKTKDNQFFAEGKDVKAYDKRYESDENKSEDRQFINEQKHGKIKPQTEKDELLDASNKKDVKDQTNEKAHSERSDKNKSPDPTKTEDRKFFDDVNEKLEKVQVSEIKPKGENKKNFDGVREKLEKDERSQHKHRPENVSIKSQAESKGLVHSAMETMLIDKVQSLLMPTTPDSTKAKDNQFFAEEKDVKAHDKKYESDETKSEDRQFINEEKDGKIKPQTEKDELLDASNKKDVKDQINEKTRSESSDKNKSLNEKKERKLVRQDSIHSTDGTESCEMSKDKDSSITSCKLTHAPVLQNFHPILSGSPLETIPSLPESSLDRSESLDVEGVEKDSTNGVSVCCNSHAACGVDRSERERDREKEKCDKDRGSPRHARHESYGGREPVGSVTVQNASLNSSSTPLGIHRRSSDSDLSVTPKGSSLNASAGIIGSGGGAILRPSMNSNNLEMLEYPFLTMTEYPPGFIVHIGGTVCARSVKLVDAGGESAARAAWWAELRTELRAHARALRCTAVLAYSERAAVRDDVCVLSASGTAAVINLDCGFTTPDDSALLTTGSKNALDECEIEPCSMAHVPYSPGAGPYRAELSTCGGCRRARVPTVLLATCAKPNRLTSYAKAVTLTTVAARCRRAVGAEAGARDLSDQLPFLEYELHKLLLAKLRMQGANAIFSLQTQIAIGERCVMALASGTAVRLGALPPPAPPRIKASENDRNAIEIQKALWDTFTANKAANGYDVGSQEHSANGVLPEVEGDEAPALDLCADKDACVLELDEAEDVETAKALAVRRSHMQVFTSTLRPAPAAPPHAFMQVWRARLGSQGSGAERLVASALTGAAYKLRRLQPAALAAPSFQLELPEDEIQLVVSGTAIPLYDPSKMEHSNGVEKDDNTVEGDDDIFALDEEQLVKAPPEVVEDKNAGPGAGRVSLTTLSTVEGTKVARRVCSLRLLFVRETTAVRELGGLSGFLHTFTCEVLAIVRAYTAALGGNALTSLYLAHLLLHHNAHKNQSQCLLSVGGDVVHITY